VTYNKTGRGATDHDVAVVVIGETQIPINVGDPAYDPLFAYGFGLTYP
jgi:hypothetical protein